MLGAFLLGDVKWEVSIWAVIPFEVLSEEEF